ncbi:hypothetical protein GCM10027295_00960 [Pseudaeromonas pectinilytica]
MVQSVSGLVPIQLSQQGLPPIPQRYNLGIPAIERLATAHLVPFTHSLYLAITAGVSGGYVNQGEGWIL